MTFGALKRSRVYIRRLLAEKNRAVISSKKDKDQIRNLEDYREVLNELELERALEEARSGSLIKRPENTEVALVDNHLPSFYSRETTFRILGNKKYDETIKRRVLFRKVLQYTFPSITVLSSPFWFDAYFNLVKEIMGSSILGSILLENSTDVQVHLAAAAFLAAPLLTFISRAATDFPRYLISGIYVTADRSLSFKCYHLRNFTAEKKFISVLDSSAVMADYSDISSTRGLPLIVIDRNEDSRSILSNFRKRRLKQKIERNFYHIENYLLAPQKAFEDAREYKLSKNTLAPLAEKQIENVLGALKHEKANPIRLEFSDSYFNIPLHPRIDSLKNLPLLYFQLFSIETLKASALKRELARKRF